MCVRTRAPTGLRRDRRREWGSGSSSSGVQVCAQSRARAWRSLNTEGGQPYLGAALLLSSWCDDHAGTRAEPAAAACTAAAAASRNTADRSDRCSDGRGDMQGNPCMYRNASPWFVAKDAVKQQVVCVCSIGAACSMEEMGIEKV